MKQSWVTILFGLSLFFLVMSVLYFIISLAPKGEPDFLGMFAPFVILSGLFIFLIGAMLVALSIFKWLGGFNTNKGLK
ncbi:Uncharacterised protein [uncultured archaeon]|nr:Uncharacterised protein [uncultured archaeon]